MSKVELLKFNLDLPYDTRFVASETNAVLRTYIDYNTGNARHPIFTGTCTALSSLWSHFLTSLDYYLVSERRDACGKLVVTQTPGQISPDIITASYKLRPAEGERRRTDEDSIGDDHSRDTVRYLFVIFILKRFYRRFS
jgi:hypothetical protein